MNIFEKTTDSDMLSSPEAMLLLQNLKYVGTEQLSRTQEKKLKRQAVHGFLTTVRGTYQWRTRIPELWRYYGDTKFSISTETVPAY